MIGGDEKIFTKWSSRYNGEYLEFICRQVKRLWPKMIIQDVNSVEPFDKISNIPFYKLNELFFYKNREAYESWIELGADESNQNTMIHVIEEWDTITLIFDDPHQHPISRLIELVSLFNQDYKHRIPMRKAA